MALTTLSFEMPSLAISSQTYGWRGLHLLVTPSGGKLWHASVIGIWASKKRWL
jgi:hypothetical protein